MLQAMRNLAQSFIIKGMMLILMISFSVWGINDIFRGNPLKRTVASAGRTDISVQDLNREFQKSLGMVRSMLGQEISGEQAKKMGLMNTALNNLIKRALVSQAATDLGLDVSSKSAYEQIATRLAAEDKNGHFDRERLNNYLRQQQLSENDLSDQIIRGELTSVFAASNFVPSLIVNKMTEVMGQKRILDVITVLNKNMPPPTGENEKEIQDFYNKNPKFFTAPEFRTLTYVRLSTDELAKSIPFTEDEIQKAYTDAGDKLTRPEQRDILQVVVQNEEKAKKLVVAARNSKNLQSAAKALGLEAHAIDQIDASALVPELSKPVFALKEGTVSDPLHSSLGYHVIEVSKIYAAGKPNFLSIKEELKHNLQHDRAVEKITQTINQLDDELAASHPLDEIASSLKLSLVKVPSTSAEGLSPDEKPLENLPPNIDLLKPAFLQNSGDSSSILDDKNGNYYVVRTDEITPSAVRPLKEVAAKAKILWVAEVQEKEATDLADKMVKQLHDGKSIAEIADANGITLHRSKPISLLGDSDPDISEQIVPSILNLKLKEAMKAPLPDRQLVLSVAEIVNIDAKANADARRKVSEELTAHKNEVLFDEYTNYLNRHYTVKINQDVLEGMNDQGG